MKINWLQKLTSRKFWIALADFVGMLIVALGYSDDTATRIVALIMAGAGALGYLIAEGLTDAAAMKAPTYEDTDAAETVYNDAQ